MDVIDAERSALAIYDTLLALIGRRAAEIEPRPLAAGSLDGRAWVVGHHPGYARRLGYGAAASAELLVDALGEVEGRVPR